jgi:hypothetical protein
LQCDEESWFNSQQEEEIFLYFMMSWLAKWPPHPPPPRFVFCEYEHTVGHEPEWLPLCGTKVQSYYFGGCHPTVIFTIFQ